MSQFDAMDTENQDLNNSGLLYVNEHQHYQLLEYYERYPKPSKNQFQKIADDVGSDELSVRKWYKMREADVKNGEENNENNEEEIMDWNQEIENLKRSHKDQIHRRDQAVVKFKKSNENLEKKLAEMQEKLKKSNENGKILEQILASKESEIREKNEKIQRLLAKNRDSEGFEKMENSEESHEIQNLKQEIQNLKKKLDSEVSASEDVTEKLMDLEFENSENQKKIKELEHLLETERVPDDVEDSEILKMKLQKKDEKIQYLNAYIEDVLKLKIKNLEFENQDYHDSMLRIHQQRVEDVKIIKDSEREIQGFKSTVTMLQKRMKTFQEQHQEFVEDLNLTFDDEARLQRIQKMRKFNGRLRQELEERTWETENARRMNMKLLSEAEVQNEGVKELRRKLKEMTKKCHEWERCFQEGCGQEYTDEHPDDVKDSEDVDEGDFGSFEDAMENQENEEPWVDEMA